MAIRIAHTKALRRMAIGRLMKATPRCTAIPIPFRRERVLGIRTLLMVPDGRVVHTRHRAGGRAPLTFRRGKVRWTPTSRIQPGAGPIFRRLTR
jgi:hypothetical protein